MFTWICPQCGAEVPPHLNECPRCAERAAQPQAAVAPPAVAPQAPAAPPPPPPQRTPPQQQAYVPPPPAQGAPVQQQAYGNPPVQYVYVQKPGPPGWLVTLGVAAIAGLLVGGFYYYVSNRNAIASGAPKVAFEEPQEAASQAAPAPPSASKYLEAAGVRIFEDAKKPRLRFLLVNHAAADLADIKGTVAVLVKDGAKEVGTLPFSVDQIRAYEAKEVEGPLKTKLRAYELPDWQFVRVEIRLNE